MATRCPPEPYSRLRDVGVPPPTWMEVVRRSTPLYAKAIDFADDAVGKIDGSGWGKRLTGRRC